MELSIASNPRSALQHLRQATRLPLETLVQIFLLSLPPLHRPQAPQKKTLALVCRLWNEIVNSTPILWSGISNVDLITYVQKSLVKSGQHPIDIYGGSGGWFLPAVISDAERWRHVSLVARSQKFLPSVTSFSQLRSLELRSGSTVPIHDGFLLLLNGVNSPHLREVRLRSTLHWGLVSLPPGLSILEIQNIDSGSPSMNTLLTILATCPNLTVLRLRNITGEQQVEGGDKNGHANVPAVVELTALQELELNQVSADYVRGFLNRPIILDECIVSVQHRDTGSKPSTSFLTPALSHHRESFQHAKVAIIVFPHTISLVAVRQRWRLELILYGRDNTRDALEWFNISNDNRNSASSGSETLQAGPTASDSTPVVLKLDKLNQSSTFSFEQLAPVFGLQCISRIEIDGLSAREQSSFFWYLSGPEGLEQPSRVKDYDASDNPGPKRQTTGVWPFPRVSELVLKRKGAQAMRALLDAIKRRSGDGVTAGVPGMPARLERIEFVEGDEPTERGNDYLDAERLVLEILDALDDDAELWWRGKRISKA